MSDVSSAGQALQGNVTPQIDPPQVGVGPDIDKQGTAVLAPKHPHWRNDPAHQKRMDGLANAADPRGNAFQGDIRSRLDDLTNTGNDHTLIGPP